MYQYGKKLKEKRKNGLFQVRKVLCLASANKRVQHLARFKGCLLPQNKPHFPEIWSVQ
jgi:hypothetical protein